MSEDYFRIESSTPMENGYEVYNGWSAANVGGQPVSLFIDTKGKSPSNKTQETDTKTNSTTAEKLHSDWQLVLTEEAKVKQSKVKCNPNISEKFFTEIEEAAKRLKCKPEDLAAIIYRESHFDPKAKNGQYLGLIQMDKTAFDSIPDRKCTYSQYCKLPREKQLNYAEKYLQMRINEKGLKGKNLTGGQLYTLIWRPADINKKSTVNEAQKRVNAAKQVPATMKKTKLAMGKNENKKFNVKT